MPPRGETKIFRSDCMDTDVTENYEEKSFPVLTLFLATFPFVLLAVFFSYVLRARLFLGHWPSYNQPDPKQLGWWIQHSFLQVGFVALPAVALGAVILAIVGRFQRRDFPVDYHCHCRVGVRCFDCICTC
jgi:hypothetical protein